MDIITILCLLAALANAVLTVYTFFKARRSYLTTLFLIMMIWLTLFVFATFITRILVTPFTLRLNTSFGPPLAASFYVFSLYLCGRNLPAVLIVLFYLPALIFFGLSYTDLIIKDFSSVSFTGVNYQMGLLFPHLGLLAAVYAVGGMYLLIKKYFQAEGTEKLQVQYILLGAGLFSFCTISADVIMPLIGSFHINNIASASSIVFTGLVTYAIVAHRLLNIDMIINKAVLFGGLLSFIILIHFGFLVFYQYAVIGSFDLALTLFSTVSLLFLLIVLNPFRKKLQDIVDQMVYGQRYSYQKDIREAVSDLIKFHDKQSLLNFVVDNLTEKMDIENAILLLEEENNFLEGQGDYKIVAGRGILEFTKKNINFKKIAFLAKYANENKKPILKEDLLMNFPGDLHALSNEYPYLRIEVCLPLFLRRQLKGFLFLGKRRNKIYDISDIDLLRTLSIEMMIAWENVQLFEKEKEAAARLAEFQARAKYAEILEEKNIELLKMYKDLKETQDQLVKTERLASISQLTVSLNHEINNPLTSILGHIQLILLNLKRGKEFSSAELEKFLEQVESDAKRIKDLLFSLRKLTEPVVTEYIGGVSMIDLQLKAEDLKNEQD
jgi:hypothetical protein